MAIYLGEKLIGTKTDTAPFSNHINDNTIHVTQEEKKNWESKGYQIGDIRFSMNSLGNEWVYIDGSSSDHTIEEYPEFASKYPVLWSCKALSNSELSNDDYFQEKILFCGGKWWGLNDNGYLYYSSDGRNWIKGTYIGNSRKIAVANNKLIYWNLGYSSDYSDNITYYVANDTNGTSFTSYTFTKTKTAGFYATQFGYWNGTYFILGDQYLSGHYHSAIFTNSTLTSTNWEIAYANLDLYGQQFKTFPPGYGYILEENRIAILSIYNSLLQVYIFNENFNSTPTIITIDNNYVSSSFSCDSQILKFKNYYFIFTDSAVYYSPDLINWEKTTELFKTPVKYGSLFVAQCAFVCNDALYCFHNLSNNVQSYQIMTDLFDVKESIDYSDKYIYITSGAPNSEGTKFVVTGMPSSNSLGTIVNDTFSFPEPYAVFGSSSIKNGQLKVR